MRFFVIGLLTAFAIFGISLDVDAQAAGNSDSSDGSDSSDLLVAGAIGLAGAAGAAALYMRNRSKKSLEKMREQQNYLHGRYRHNGNGHAEYGPHPEYDVYTPVDYGAHSGHGGYFSHSEHAGNVAHFDHAGDVGHFDAGDFAHVHV